MAASQPSRTIFISDVGSYIGRHLVHWLVQNRSIETPPLQKEGAHALDTEKAQQQSRAEQEEDEQPESSKQDNVEDEEEEEEIDLGDENAPDEEEEDEEKEDEEEGEEISDSAGTWRIVGSLKTGDTCPKEVYEVKELETEDSVNTAYESDQIILSLEEQPNETSAIIGALRSDTESKKVVVGISTVEVWGKTKIPKNAEGLTEDHYRRRKAPADLQDTLTLETHLQSLKKSKMRTHIIGSGVVYGHEQGTLHELFKEAWLCDKPTIKVPSKEEIRGKNVIPMIHVTDLCSVIGTVAGADPEQEYILACDDAQNTLKDVCLAIAKHVGPGKIEHVDSAKADELTTQHPEFRRLQVNLKLDMSSAAIQSMEFEWKSKEGFVETIEEERKEFIASRDLRPLKLAVLGPPAVGKTFVADKLAERYSLDVIRARDALEEIIREPVRFISPDASQPTNEDIMSGQKTETKAAEEEGGDEDEDEGKEGEEAEDLGMDRAESEFATQLRKKVKEVLQEKQRLPEGLMGVVVRWVISSPRHKNRGYILDGFPRSYKEAESLLSEESGEENVDLEALAEQEAEEGGEDEEIPEVAIVQELAPNGVLIYDAPDDVLQHKVEEEHADDEGQDQSETPVNRFERRLRTYRFNNGPDRLKSVGYFFQQQVKVQPLPRDVEKHIDEQKEMEAICPYIEGGGRPFNYEEVKEEEKEKPKPAATTEAATETEGEEAAKKKEKAAQRDHEQNAAAQRLQEIAKAEAEQLEERSAPVRQYLMQTVIPDLTEGLLEASRAQAEDPVEYLAQYLFRCCESESEQNYAM
eukprot:gb/GECG01016176.1/.p1 GENE.gb/GECG01016176.1/~~gb/GECG01016176.1/.p1  ORF type:complete len:808 (+),score=186.34 gb/GECG01016176.1/:1-2424(+)